MGHRYRLLVDENVEHVESALRSQGHDAERVEAVAGLGRGAADRPDIVPYLKRTGRAILTYDSHFTGHTTIIDPAALPGVLYIPDESLTPNQIVRIIGVMSEVLPPSALNGRVQHVTRSWLRYE